MASPSHVAWMGAVAILTIVSIAVLAPTNVSEARGLAQKRGASKSTRADYDDLARPAKRLPWVPRPLLAGRVDGRLVAVLDGEVFERSAPTASWDALGPILESGSTLAAPVALAVVEPAGWRACLRDGRIVESTGLGDRHVVASLAREEGAVAVVAELDGSAPWVAIAAASGRRGAVLVFTNGSWSQVGEVPGTITAACKQGGAWRVVADGVVLEVADGRVNSRSSLVGANVYGMSFRTSENGWIAADRGMLIETSDGGSRWLPRPVGQDLVFEWVEFATPTLGLALAAEAPSGRVRRGHVYTSRDAGRTWSRAASGEHPLSEPITDESGRMCILDAGGALFVSSASGSVKPGGSIRRSRGAGTTRTSDSGKAKGASAKPRKQ
jgi:hypothetical protein